MFSKEHLALLNVFGKGASKESIELLTKDLDIDNSNYLYLLMLGVIGFNSGWDHYPKEMIPRIQGIHRYEQVKNSSSVPWLAKRIEVLGCSGIDVMITGNTAMRYAFLPDVTRFIRGYDITVPSGDYDRAAELLRNEIKESEKSEFNNRTINGLTEINLHKGVHDHRLFDEEPFWSAGHDVEFRSYKVRAPSLEDQLMFCLCTPYGQYLAREKGPDRIYRLVSVLQMLRYKQVDLEKLSAGAKEKNVNCQLRFQLELLRPYSDALQGLDPEMLAGEKEYCTYLSKLTGYRDHPSVRKEYQLINSCFRPEDKQVSFPEYIAETRNIHSLNDLGRHIKKKNMIRKEERDQNHDAK